MTVMMCVTQGIQQSIFDLLKSMASVCFEENTIF